MAVHATPEQARQWQRQLRGVTTHKPGKQTRPRKGKMPRVATKNVKTVTDGGTESRFSRHVRRARKWATTPQRRTNARTPIRRAGRVASKPFRIGFTTFGMFLVGVTGVAIALTVLRAPSLFMGPVRILLGIFRAFVTFAGGK